jgi:hypothetical protein
MAHIVIWEYTHPIRKRTWSIDSDGIHEHRCGRVFVSIHWDDLQRLSLSSARSTNGKRISLLIDRREAGEFFHHASREWRDRHPDRCSRNSQRLKRVAHWAAYFWLPLLTLGPCLAFYIMDWLLGWPDALSPQLQKINRLTIFGVLFSGAFIPWYWFRSRKVDEAVGPANRGLTIRPETNRTSAAGAL